VKKQTVTSVQPKPKGKGRDINTILISALEARAEMGRKKYGERLRAFNGRDAMMDWYCEELDRIVYMTQWMEEQGYFDD
jgi:hypothetical protein